MMENNSKNKKALGFLGEILHKIYHIEQSNKFEYQLKMWNNEIHFARFVFKGL